MELFLLLSGVSAAPHGDNKGAAVLLAASPNFKMFIYYCSLPWFLLWNTVGRDASNVSERSKNIIPVGKEP